MKYFIVAGEKSGDLHGGMLVKYLRENDPEAEISGIGGDSMQAQGISLFQHIKTMSFMGLWDVLVHLPQIFGSLRQCKSDLLKVRPHVLILIDYVEYNLKMAKFAKQNGILVYFYISPQIWAWNVKRVYKIQKRVHQMFVILHFEKAFYQKYGIDVIYEGHPLVDQLANFQPIPRDSFLKKHQIPEKPIIALLPGTRKQELHHILPTMLKVSQDPKFSNYQFVIAAVHELPSSIYRKTEKQNISVVYDDTYQLLTHSHAALVTSGTATLETALFGIPQVVCYKAKPFNYHLFKLFVKVPYISLVNLISKKSVVKELIQNEFNETNLRNELECITYGLNRKQILSDYQILKTKLGKPNVSERIAKNMIEGLQVHFGKAIPKDNSH